MEEEKKYLDYKGLQTYHTNLCNIIEDNEQVTAAALDDLDDRLKSIETENPYSKLEIDDLLDPIIDKLNDIEEFAEVNIQSDWNQTDSSADDYIKNKPTIPSVGDAEVEILKNGTKIGSFTTNLSGSKVTVNIAVPTGTAADKDVPTSGDASTSQVVMGNDSRLTDSRNANDVYSWAKESMKPSYTSSEVGLGNVTNDAQVKRTEMGANNGVATLDENGKVPSSQLPSYVDDVIEGYYYNSKFYKEAAHTTEIIAESGKIYVDLATDNTYRWSGSAYTQIKGDLTLGETSSTAYRGDHGKIAYDHSQSTHARTDATAVEASETNGNIKINGTETTVYTHPGSGTNPHGTTKSDVGLGNVGNFKAVSTVADQGLSTQEQSNARANIGAGTGSYSKPSDGIPKTDLASGILTSLGLADSAIQTITAQAGANINAVGTPSVTASTSGNATTLTFNYLKGAKGENGTNGTNGTSAEWFTGTAMNGTGTKSISITGAKAGDMYLNTSTYDVYKASSASSWTYQCNIKGATGSNGSNGNDGAAAGFGTPTATVDANVGTPSVTVTASGANTSKVFAFEFKNLKGQPGTNGTNGTNGTSAYWFSGTAITGTGTGISASVSGSKAGDMYLNTSTSYVYTATAANTWNYVCSIKGGTGSSGSAATINVGTVSTGSAGSSASVTNSGTTSAAVLNFTIPKGDKGDTGNTGTRGSMLYWGTGITGTDTTSQIFSGSGISSALVNDMYINTNTYNIYQCTTAGNASTAKWKYIGCIKGTNGSTPTILASNGSDIGTVGTPSVTANTVGTTTTFTFHQLKGASGTNGTNGTNGTSAEWFTGTAMSGTGTKSVTVSGAKAGDMYLNTSTYDVYKASSASSWTYQCNIKGATGSNGSNGAAAGFGTPTATVDANVGTPSVTVSASGADTAKVFAFTFKNLKGQPGTNGTNGTNGTSAYWFSGTAVTGTNTSGISASVSGSKAGDMYLNTSTYNVYKATAANTWGYVCNIKGTNATTTSVFNASNNGLAPAASSGNKTTAESEVSNYYLCADAKYRQLPANAFKDTTYSSLLASSGSTDVSLCTRGEKYTWNNKQALVAKLGSTTKPVYTSEAGTFAECSTYAGGTAVTLNGTSKAANTASFYAPTEAGTSGQVLISNGSGAPSWGAPSYANVSYGVNTANVSGAVSIDGRIPLHILTVTANVSSVALSNSPSAGHTCHVIFKASSAMTVALAYHATDRVTPDGDNVNLSISAGGYVELNFLSDGTKVYVRGI